MNEFDVKSQGWDSNPAHIERAKVIADEIRKSVLIDLEKEAIPADDFDIIFTQMTLHHVHNIDGIFFKFSRMLRPGGILYIADLYKEDGLFHGNDFTGHNGFDPEELSHPRSKLRGI